MYGNFKEHALSTQCCTILFGHYTPLAIYFLFFFLACKATRVVGEKRSKTQTHRIMEEADKLRTEKERSALGTKFGLRFTPNPMLDLDVDFHE